MKWNQGVILVLLIVICVLCIIIYNGSLEGSSTLKAVIYGVSLSMMASAFCLLVFWQIGAQNRDQTALNIAEGIKGYISELKSDENFIRVGRNNDFEEEFWVSLIDDLDVVTEPVWFVGNKLKEWRNTPTYSKILKEKLLKRLKNAIETKKTSWFKTYIFLGDKSALNEWSSFIDNLKDELLKTLEISEKSSQDRVKKEIDCYIIIRHIPPEKFKYALTLCHNRLVVVNYVGASSSHDNPTFDINSKSPIRALYEQDLKHLLESVD